MARMKHKKSEPEQLAVSRDYEPFTAVTRLLYSTDVKPKPSARQTCAEKKQFANNQTEP
jgi:hypothetical protein